jgi:phage tail protein X
MKTISSIQGDEWDFISFKQYGSEYYEDQLIEANPDLRLVVRFGAGVKINVPEVEPMPIRGLPPWRRVLQIR